MRKIDEMPVGSGDGRAARCRDQVGRPGTGAEDLVRDARLDEGRQGRLLLPERSKFKTRYATFGFSERAKLDDGNMWPNAFALKKLTKADEKRILALVKQAVE